MIRITILVLFRCHRLALQSSTTWAPQLQERIDSVGSSPSLLKVCCALLVLNVSSRASPCSNSATAASLSRVERFGPATQNDTPACPEARLIWIIAAISQVLGSCIHEQVEKPVEGVVMACTSKSGKCRILREQKIQLFLNSCRAMLVMLLPKRPWCKENTELPLDAIVVRWSSHWWSVSPIAPRSFVHDDKSKYC